MFTEIDRFNFVEGFKSLQKDAAGINRKNGFVEQEAMIDELESYLSHEGMTRFLPLIQMFRDARVGLKLMLVVSELGEALESVRKSLGPDDHIPQHSAEAAEIADAMIRLMNYATDRKLNVAEAIADKNEFNRNRADHSKEGRAQLHGKRF